MSEYLIGAVEAGGTKFVAALARQDGTLLARETIPTLTPAQTMGRLVTFLREASATHGPIAGIGVASFGPIDVNPASPACGTITSTPKPGWSGLRYGDWLEQLGAPMAVDTDVNGAALGEWLAGAGQGCETLAYTTVGTGIGTGVIHNGRPRAGFSHFEAGHIRVPHDLAHDPFPGMCPYHGDCLEGLASGPAVKARWGESLDAMADPAAAVDLLADYLADFAATLVLLHMPDRLVFGGGVMKAPGLLEALRRKAEARLAGYIVSPRLDPGLATYIGGPGLGDLAGITGATELGRQAIAKAANAA